MYPLTWKLIQYAHTYLYRMAKVETKNAKRSMQQRDQRMCNGTNSIWEIQFSASDEYVESQSFYVSSFAPKSWKRRGKERKRKRANRSNGRTYKLKHEINRFGSVNRTEMTFVNDSLPEHTRISTFLAFNENIVYFYR